MPKRTKPAAAREAAPKPPATYTLHHALETHVLAGPVLFPDGKRAVVQASRADVVKNRFATHLYEIDLATFKHRALTASEQASTGPVVAPDGSRILFLRRPTRDDPPELYALPAAGGEPVRLTTTRFGVTSFRVEPSGRVVYLRRETVAEGTWRQVSQARKAGDDARPHNVLGRGFELVALPAEGKETVIARLDPGTLGFALAPRDRAVYTVTTLDGRFDTHRTWVKRIDPRTGREKLLTDGRRRFYGLHPHPDGRRLLVLAATSAEHFCTAKTLFLLDPATGGLRNLLPGIDREILQFRIARDGRSARFNVADGAGRSLYSFEFKTMRAVRLPVDGVATDVAGDAAPGGSLVVVESEREAPELALVDARGKAARRTSFNAHLRGVARAKQETLAVPSADGFTVESVLVHPLRRPARGKPPLLVVAHGGPYAHAVNTFHSFFLAQYWAALGYAIVMPNFRGSMGYGSAFSAANVRDLGGGDFRDVTAAADAALRRLDADPARVGIVGASYGGYMANWAIGQTDRFVAAVSRFGIFSIATDFLNSDLPGWELAYVGKFPWEDPEAYRRMSPATHAASVRTPVLITHGEGDTNTFISNSKEMYRTLRALKRPCRLVTYPRAGHGFEEPRHRLDEMRRIAAWFRDFLILGRKAATHDELAEGRVEVDGREAALVRLERCEPPAGVTPKGRMAALRLTLDAKPGDPGRLKPLSTAAFPVGVELASGARVAPAGLLSNGLYVTGAPELVFADPKTGGALLLELLFDLPVDDPPVAARIGKESFPVAL